MTIEKGKITHDISKLPTGELKINLMNDYMLKLDRKVNCVFVPSFRPVKSG